MLPLNWQRVKVKDFGIIITGSTPLTQISEYWNGTISWITPTDINDNKDIFNSERKITQKGLDTIRMIPKNSVLVTCIASIGKNAILRVNGACNQQINAIIPNKDFNADFIYYLMENNKRYLLGKAGVTATYIISKQVFEEIDFFVPKDLNEQIAIANILSDVDRYLCSLDALILKKEGVKKALSFELLSQRKRLKGFNQAWQRVRLGDIAEINPPTIIPNVFYYIDLESVEKGQLLNKQLMTKNKAPSRARRLLSKNDILYQLVRPYQRNNYFFTLNGNYVASTGYAQIRTLQNPSFLYFALHSNYFVNAVLDRCEGTSYPAISSNELKKCEVILPPLNEQIAIANILSTLDHEIISLKNKKRQFENIKKALNHDLMSAKIRVLKK